MVYNNFSTAKSTFSSSKNIKDSSEYLLNKKLKLKCINVLCNITETKIKLNSQCEIGVIGILTPISYLG
jgi:hypothetical protein